MPVMKNLSFLLFFCLLWGISLSQTYISGGAVEGTWRLKNSPYIIQGDIHIAVSKTLEIESGVQVEFPVYASLKVYGQLIATGTSSNLIEFYPTGTDDWHGIRFIDNNLNISDTSVLLNCSIKDGLAAGTIPDNKGGGIYCENSSKIRIDSTLIYSCAADTGAGIYLTDSSPKIRYSTVRLSSNEGIFCDQNSEPVLYQTIVDSSGSHGFVSHYANPSMDTCHFRANDGCGVLISDSASITLTGSLISSNDSAGIMVTNPDASLYIAENLVSDNNDYPVRAYASNIDGISGNLYTGNLYQRIFVTGNEINKDAEWDHAGIPFLVQGADIHVTGTDGPDMVTTLQIGPGDSILFDAVKLKIGNFSGDPGALVAEGSYYDTIYFGGATDTYQSWKGIYFDNTTHDANTLMEYCKIQYGGNFLGDENINCHLSGPTFRHCEIAHGSPAGIYVWYSSPYLNHCNIHNNQYGIYVMGGSVEADTCEIHTNTRGVYLNANSTSQPEFDSCHFHDNNQGIDCNVGGPGIIVSNCLFESNVYPVIAYGNQVRGFTSNTYNSNTYPRFLVEGDSVEITCTWEEPGIPYQVRGDLYILKASGSPTQPCVLTLTPGTVIEFDENCGVVVGGATRKGGLVAEGTINDSIIFEFSGFPGGTHWDGITFYDNASDTACRLSYCRIDEGGTSLNASLYIHNSNPEIIHTVISRSSNMGIYSFGGARPELQHCTIKDNTTIGCYLNLTSSILPDMDSCQFEENGNHGLYIAGTYGPDITNGMFHDNAGSGLYISCLLAPIISGNTFTDNQVYPIEALSRCICEISGNTYAGNTQEMIHVFGGEINWDCTIHNDTIPFYVTGGDMRIKNNTVANTLTIDPGVSLIFNGNGLRIGDDLQSFYPGGLIAEGTMAAPITFTGTTASPGSWKGLYLAKYSVDTTNSLDHCIVEYGGAGSLDNITLNDCYADIRNCISSNADGAAIKCMNGSTPDIQDCLFINSDNGIDCDTASPNIRNVTIANHTAGVFCRNQSFPNISNTVVYDCTNGIDADVTLDTLEFCDFFNNTMNYTGPAPADFGVITHSNQNGDPCDADSNIFLEPMFVDPVADNYSLSLSSKCIDAADIHTDTVNNPADISGNPRWLFNYVDVGCYEFGSYWTGRAGTSWADSLNWANHTIPGDSSRVIIPTNYTNSPQVNTTQSCYEIEVKSGSTLEVIGGGNLRVKGK